MKEAKINVQLREGIEENIKSGGQNNNKAKGLEHCISFHYDV